MTRQPIQVLVIPFRRRGSLLEFCILRRSDDAHWQFVAGGVEADEAPLEAAKRESFEEAGLPLTAQIVVLDSHACVPANIFRDWDLWPAGTYVVKEIAFGIDVSGNEIKVSQEHTEFRWCKYDEAMALLRWDSNKTALWELVQRLQNMSQ